MMMDFLIEHPIIPIAFCVAAIVTTVFLMAYGSPNERRLRKRLDEIMVAGGNAAGKKEEGGVTSTPALRAVANRRRGTAASDKRLSRILPNMGLLRLKLERAGFDISVTAMLLIAGGLALVSTFTIMWFAHLSFLLSLISGVAIGVTLPSVIISSRGKGRAKLFLKDLPDAIDLIVRSVKSGLPISEAIHAIARDLSGPAADEFTRISDQIQIGVPLNAALSKSVQRLGLTDYSFLAVSLSITQETGGNLSEALSNLSRLLRSRQQMHLKIRALSSEARASALIIGALPFVVMAALLVLNPNYINVLFEEDAGHTVLYFSGLSMALGFGVMAKMVRFDF
ncbi:type II secretion system F family protein [Iodidimonas sp. SYSU 1G8]|uniref:type II secretion system F family protein n=1 Tax=Iodidimonas sp. SYSU 1G8 TaxID=3133967 RepID=UPI0031FEF0AC